MQRIFKGFNITVERVIITDLKNSTYFARLILQQQNEVARKIVEIDARPSDCLAIAAAQKKPIFVTSPLFEQVEDMSEVLNRISTKPGARLQNNSPTTRNAHHQKIHPLALVCGDDEFAVKQRARQLLYQQWSGGTRRNGSRNHRGRRVQ